MQRWLGWFGFLGLLVGVGAAEALAPAADPHFQEVLRLIRANLPGVEEEDLNRAMVRGLLDHFRPRVMLVTNRVDGANTAEPCLRRSALMEGGYGYVGLRRIGPGVAEAVDKAIRSFGSSKELRGLLLDLRFAAGTDYREAAKVADRFVAAAGRSLISWDEEDMRSTSSTNDVSVPVVVLVNGGTLGAAEALAGAIRENGYAVVTGTSTGAAAVVDRVFQLEEGRELRIATGTVKVGEAVELVDGITPDIAVPILPEEIERQWLEDPYREIEGHVAATNRTRVRMNEAELVRRRDSTNPPAGARDSRPAGGSSGVGVVPALQDPILARGLDLLKGLTVVSGAPRSQNQ